MISLGAILLFLGDIESEVHRFHQPVKLFLWTDLHRGWAIADRFELLLFQPVRMV